MSDRFLLHYTQKNPRNWRLRCLEKHPRDPGWEVGTYEKCHPSIRPKHRVGDTIIDVVTKDKKPVIRSMFTITDIKDTDEGPAWYFDEFYYSDSEPYELPRYYIQYRGMYVDTYLKKFPSEDPREFVKKNYTLYRKGEKPASIKENDWDKILEMRKERIKRTKC